MKKIIIPFFCAVLLSTSVNANVQRVTTIESNVKSQLSPQQIIDKYIEALGGKAKLESVKSSVSEDVISAQGMEIKSVTKKMGNKFKSVQSIMGQEIVSVFDGVKGHSNQTGTKVEFTPDRIVELKKGKTIDALGLDASKFTSAVETLDGKSYNVLVSDAVKLYFDTSTGLLYKTGNAMSGAVIKSYITVDGIKFPEQIEAEGGGQKVIIKTTKVTVNSGVTDADFQ
ncbi:hypothetical protein IX39_02630 [Chryseobacterium formosense]|uniref:Uncharacterized protein n=1 Tax=Chryseobacterium formosense TaxID=236814 RepID=A0A085Z562_9FLAO|nr:hypothetical protein [Chryseobacterium formosense]KFE99575.1 hypothetical protein IX39_02630 [Chryseobacterium formosense]SFT80596.1 hypothetical protein SAMN05421857_3363 [Chryseobacterium formosense]